MHVARFVVNRFALYTVVIAPKISLLIKNILTDSIGESESQILEKKMEMHSVQRKMHLVRVYQSYEAIEALRSTFHSPANGHEMTMHEIALKAQVQIHVILSIGKMARDVAFRHENDALEKHMLENHILENHEYHMLEKFNNKENNVEKHAMNVKDVQESLDVAYTMLSFRGK